jgi:hypothetical protein
LTFLLDFTFVPATNIRAFQKLFLCRLRYYLHTKRCSAFRVEKKKEGFRKRAADGTQVKEQNNHT